MPPFEGKSDSTGALRRNGFGEPVQAKLAALLDDVTVRAANLSASAAPLMTADEPAAAQPEETNPDPNRASEVAQIAAQIKSIQAAADRLASDPPKAAPPGLPPAPGALNIKGRGDGIAIEIGKGAWPELLEQLRERLVQAANFFRGANVALDVGARPLLENELDAVRVLLDEAGMRLGVVRTAAERTFESAVALGLSAKLVDADGASEAEIDVAETNRNDDRFFVYRGNLRSGQVLERSEHIIVVGDVNPGASVISNGDILVWGRMRGIAHAGAAGDLRSTIVALHLDPIQLRIGAVIAIEGNEAGRTGRRIWKVGEKRPELAYVQVDQLVIEPWDESKPGGLAAFRR